MCGDPTRVSNSLPSFFFKTFYKLAVQFRENNDRLQRSYDRIEWDFLLACLQQLGFHDKWIQWIKECISTVSYSVIVNSEPCGFFKPTRGLRQGDPLSPYLFILCMDVLARRLHEQSLCPKSGIGIKIAPPAARIPCLLFADDSLLFCKASAQSCHKLKDILDTFCAQSGQVINFHKSSIVFSKNTRSFDRQVVGGIFNIPHSSSIGKYLGCSLFQGRPSPALFQELPAKATAKLSNWKKKCFSKAGRVVLIQSNLEALPVHAMQCYKLPGKISEQLDRINRDFFWKHSHSNKGMPLVAWDKVCRPKQLGGLGLRKTAAVNIAYLAKLGWKFLTQPGNFWVQHMRAKYGSPASFFDLRSKRTDSWVWKCLLRIRTFLQQGLRWKVGNGSSINFWTDSWCFEDSLVNKLNLDRSSVQEADIKVSAFITPDRQWDLSKLRHYVPHGVLQQIQGIPLPYTDVEDSFCWGHTGSGIFSTKSATWRAHENIDRNQPDWQFKWIWKLDILPKIKIFLWQLCHKALPSRGTLLRRGVQLDPLCPACNTEIEDTDHIFIHCPTAQKVWELAVTHQWIPMLPFDNSVSSLHDGLHVLAHNRHPRLSRIVLLLWSLWKSRNARTFKNETPSPLVTLLRAKRSWAEWSLRQSSSSLPSSTPSFHQQQHHPPSTHFIRWQIPVGGFIKLNFDGTKSPAGTAAGFVLRNWQGGFVIAGTRFMEQAPIIVAEATAMRDGIRAALDAGYRKIQVEGDNQIVIKAIQNQIHTPWQIATLLEDIRNMIINCEDISFTHIYREGNMAADWMAKYGCVLRCNSLSTFSSPPC